MEKYKEEKVSEKLPVMCPFENRKNQPTFCVKEECMLWYRRGSCCSFRMIPELLDRVAKIASMSLDEISQK